MGWQGSTRRSRLPRDWQHATVPRIKRRDGHRCQWPTEHGICGWTPVQIDHKIPGDDHRDDNLWCLCAWHHERKTAREGIDARAARGYVRERRAPESHPGIVQGGG